MTRRIARPTANANDNGKRHATQQSLNSVVKSICDITRRSNVGGGGMPPSRAFLGTSCVRIGGPLLSGREYGRIA